MQVAGENAAIYARILALRSRTVIRAASLEGFSFGCGTNATARLDVVFCLGCLSEGSAFLPVPGRLGRFHADEGFRAYRQVNAADLRGAGVAPLAELADGNVFRLRPGSALPPDRLQTHFDARRQALTSGAPVAQSVFDLYLAAGALHFVKRPCAGADVALRFFLHAVPLRGQDLPPARRPLGFENLDFDFGRYGVRRRDVCWASVPLPVYGLERLRVGQLADRDSPRAEPAWSVEIPDPPFPAAFRRALRAEGVAARAGTPALRSVFDVYLTARAVRFVKTPCRPADTQPRFILHVLPVRRQSLPRPRRRVGFDNLDFSFRDRSGVRFEGQCWVRAALPAYAIAQLRVGQFDSERQRDVWKATLPVRLPPETDAG